MPSGFSVYLLTLDRSFRKWKWELLLSRVPYIYGNHAVYNDRHQRWNKSFGGINWQRNELDFLLYARIVMCSRHAPILNQCFLRFCFTLKYWPWWVGIFKHLAVTLSWNTQNERRISGTEIWLQIIDTCITHIMTTNSTTTQRHSSFFNFINHAYCRLCYIKTNHL